ncbi:MAG: putative zinc-binding protein [Armatimonadota bacterium]|nr:hypothetical protein [Armatimonadota bacterium]MCX7777771.1 hypothetical protein [Armatimonadota bacterium]MDW8025342.1 putative zinc-binding protein [Armatimonadota bacterium]
MGTSEHSRLKVVVVSCNGIGMLVSTAARLAALRAQQIRPDRIIVWGAATLGVEYPRAVSDANSYPLILIDGCRPKCASGVYDEKVEKGIIKPSKVGGKVIGRIYIPEVCVKYGLSLKGEQRSRYSEKGMKVVEAIADEVIKLVDELIANYRGESSGQDEESSEQKKEPSC